MTTTPPPQSQWPKPYLLKIMDQAIAEGCIRIGPQGLDPEIAKSLIGALNRIRRRSDKQHAAFIRDEHHLITTTWEPSRGTLLVTYNSLPDGMEMPEIHSVDDEDKHQLPLPENRRPAPPLEQLPPPASGHTTTPSFNPAALIDELLAREASKAG